MPVYAPSMASSDPDTYSILSQAPSSTMTISESLPAQLVRKSARKGFTFNIMSIGPPGLGRTNLLSALFNKNLETTKPQVEEQLNPPVSIESKQFEIDEKKVRLRLTVVKSRNYGEALSLKGTHEPLVRHIDDQFADFHRREFGNDRRKLQDKMIHCMFFFISPIGHGLSKLDIDFLSAVSKKVNIIPIIAKAEALTVAERLAFKARVRSDLEKNNISIYRMPDPDSEDTDEVKRQIEDIRDAMPFAICSINLKEDSMISVCERELEWGTIDPNNRDHSDYILLKNMLHMHMSDLCDSTHDVFYEDYRLRMIRDGPINIRL